MTVEKDDYGHDILGQFTIKDDKDQLLTMLIIEGGVCINGVVIPLSKLGLMSRDIEGLKSLGLNGEFCIPCAEDPHSKIVFKRDIKLEDKFEIITTSRVVYEFSASYLKSKPKMDSVMFDACHKTMTYQFSMPVTALFSDIIVDIRADLMTTNNLKSSQMPIPSTPLPNIPTV